ncbi:MAG TPA: sugar phosphate isomerase/epimerase family protein, partial [Spirochaetia bacterium]|nr:sugar phosphate isomerase/epimerase family protein [Spirochaetia bacterium]
MAYPVIMHVNYCEQGQEIEEICQKAARWGFDGVEFRRKRIGVAESMEDYLDRIEKGVKAAGLKHVLFGYPGPLLVKTDAAERRREVAEAISFYQLVARRFKVKTVNLLTGTLQNPDKSFSYFDYTRHGSFLVTKEQWDWQVKGCQEMADGLKDVDIRFGFETHMVYVHDTVDAVRRLVAEIDRPSIGVNLDYGNIIDFQEHPSLEESIEALRGRIHYVHLKNSAPLRGAPGRMGTALAEGEINNRQFVRMLVDAGYKGPICIEAPRAGDRE